METDNGIDNAVELRRFSHGDDWEVSLHLAGAPGEIKGHAELFRQGDYKCRIVLAGVADDQWSLLNHLENRAVEWIDDWQRRAHSGDTGFSDI